VAIQEVIVCDKCKKSEPKTGFRVPRGWSTIKIEKADWSEEETIHVCSRECAADVFRALADKLVPPKVDVPKSGGPYRS
jgi:hypothetical protein